VSDLGVVDALRVPAPIEAAAARLRALPTVAQVFVALAILDAVARTIGLIEPAARLDDGLIGFLGSYLPRDAWILLPAILVLRRPTAADDTPRLFIGAVGIAAVTLVAQPALAILSGASAPDFALFAWVNVLRSLVTAWSYVLLASGLGLLNPRDPRPTAAGLANLVFLGIALATVLQLVSSVALRDQFAADVLANFANLGAITVAQLALGLVLKVVVRGLADPSRAARATLSATAGAVLLALAIVLEGLLALLGAFALGVGGLQSVEIGISAWSSSALAIVDLAGYALLFAGVALGLADPLRPMATEWDAAATANA
jgi:hypothetical protein